MATGENGDGSPYERARFYSHDEIVQARTDRIAVLRGIAAQGRPRPWYHVGSWWPGAGRALLEHRFDALKRFERDAGRPLTNREALTIVHHMGEAESIVSTCALGWHGLEPIANRQLS
jgi:hypothetical protein